MNVIGDYSAFSPFNAISIVGRALSTTSKQLPKNNICETVSDIRRDSARVEEKSQVAYSVCYNGVQLSEVLFVGIYI